MVSMDWRASRGLILAFSGEFSQFRLKKGHCNFSYKVSTRSLVLLQKQVKILGSGVQCGMEMGKCG